MCTELANVSSELHSVLHRILISERSRRRGVGDHYYSLVTTRLLIFNVGASVQS